MVEAERHRDFAATFHAVAQGIRDWDAPTPVPQWQAHDIVEHLLDWLPHVLENWAAVRLPQVRGESLPQRWADRSSEVQKLLEDTEISLRPVAVGPFTGQTLAGVIDRIYTTDIYLHAWDLARAGGLPVELDPDFARTVLDGMRPMEAALRSSGHYGPAVHTDSSDPVNQLMAFIGRDDARAAPSRQSSAQ